MSIPALEFKDMAVKRASSKKSLAELLKSVKEANGKGATVQIFDSKSIANRTHLIGAYLNSLIAFKNHTNKTKSMAMEMVLFAAMTDQIDTALNLVGAKSSADFIIFSDKRRALERISPILKKKSDFEPATAHVRSVARRFGIRATDAAKINAGLLQKMSLSRLAAN